MRKLHDIEGEAIMEIVAGRIVASMALAACLAFTGPATSQERVSPQGANVPNLSGTWMPEAWSTDEWPLEPPYSEAGRAAQAHWAAHPEQDPSYACIVPLGRILSAPLPFEIIQQPDRVTLLYEYDHQVRRVYLDGRGHPDSYPTLMGHSTGRWEADTLVIETANLEPGYLRPQGMPYSRETRLTERLTLVDGGERLRAEIVIDDPVYYAKTWGVTKYYRRTDEEIKDYECIVREHVPADGGSQGEGS